MLSPSFHLNRCIDNQKKEGGKSTIQWQRGGNYRSTGRDVHHRRELSVSVIVCCCEISTQPFASFGWPKPIDHAVASSSAVSVVGSNSFIPLIPIRKNKKWTYLIKSSLTSYSLAVGNKEQMRWSIDSTLVPGLLLPTAAALSA